MSLIVPLSFFLAVVKQEGSAGLAGLFQALSPDEVLRNDVGWQLLEQTKLFLGLLVTTQASLIIKLLGNELLGLYQSRLLNQVLDGQFLGLLEPLD